MATLIVGAILAIALFFALRHVYRNLVSGRCECSEGECPGCSDGHGQCAGCHTK